ncbi:dynein heavy chain domain-containing protein 1-like [Petaurus breviceps papuanus]|uniref:dynein heavy chain domain-containing protein 1-like n=1 Tax=Petaurus breviceps papuanus TaxID=3040969 RepID=UPI0036DBEC0B
MKSTDLQTPINPSQASDDPQVQRDTANSTTVQIEEEDEDELAPAFISLAFRAQPSEAVRIFCGPETEMVRSRQADPNAGPLEVLGHRIRSQYAPPSRIQLQNDLDTNSGIQKALAIQQALLEDVLLEVNKFCQEHKWLRGIHQFLKNWGPQKLEPMQSWPASRYLRLITELESWQSRSSEVPTMLLTENLLLHLNCDCVQTDIACFFSPVTQLADVKKDILDQLKSVRHSQSQELIKDLSEFIEVLQNISTDIQTIAKCSQKVGIWVCDSELKDLPD